MKERKYKAIYKCRLCGNVFKDQAHKDMGTEFPTGSVWKQHKCADGGYGIGDIQGSYEVKE